jgi:hypothetical protein
MAVTTLRQIRQMHHTEIDDLKKKMFMQRFYFKNI